MSEPEERPYAGVQEEQNEYKGEQSRLDQQQEKRKKKFRSMRRGLTY